MRAVEVFANGWRRWVALLDRREDPLSLAVCRIVVGTTLLHHLIATWHSGAAAAVWIDVKYGGIRALEGGVLDWIGGSSPRNVGILLAAGILSSALLAAGAFTRVSSVVAWFSFRTLSLTNEQSGGASDDLLISALFLLMFSGCGRTFSLDAWRASRGTAAPAVPVTVPAWPRYVLIGQLVVMYWMTGLQKVSASWIPGGPLDALWYILQQPTWQRIPMHWLAPLYPLTQVATGMTWIFEQSAPLLLLAFWFRHTRERPGRVRAWFNRVDFRTGYLTVGLALHLGIMAAMEVGPFFGATMALYVCCFHPAEWRRFGGRVRALAAA